MERVGIDVGGSTIKLGAVRTTTGLIASGIRSAETPSPPSLHRIVEMIGALSSGFIVPARRQKIGVALPAIIEDGRRTVGIGLGPDWHGADAVRLLADRTGCDVALINDADAAGLAEARLGDGTGQRGTVIVLTLGTFIGSALFHDGRLVPNTELGQLEFRGRPAEASLGGRAKLERGLSWRDWALEFDLYLERLEAWFSPSLIVLSGGMTRHAPAFSPYLARSCAVRISRFGETAGVVGAALFACGGTPVRPAAAPGR